MKHKYNRWIMGSAVGIAAIAAAIDHTRHKVPELDTSDIIIIQEDDGMSPCGPGDADESPCGV
ncbi:MAG: hypothetical protein KAS48_01685 [Gammaproteobacteria bacterium]|nr:hypothetical protein [Gammaproteobacteria bacterium]